MYRIYKITSHPTVDFAAEELKKYLRMMMPRAGEIVISYAPDAKDGIRLGLMEDLSLDVSEASDITLDDIIHIDTDAEGGIIAGSNPRSVLLAVYKFLTLNGCRWLFPGIDGELIPMKDIEPTTYHKMADNRYRGWCNEGAEFQQCMIDAIDFAPKIGLNVFMLEFFVPQVYYDWYYKHLHNEANIEAEPVSPETVFQWKMACEAEIAKRSLQFHDIGHGWSALPFGLRQEDLYTKGKVEIPEESRDFLALMNGARDLYHGNPNHTNLCLSNPEARRRMVEAIADYASENPHVDYLHVWLADSFNNHCECDECRKKTPSDWYVVLLNELDAKLTELGLATRIVYICYVDTTWPAETERLNNPDRFSLLLGAISRKYCESISQDLSDVKLTKYQLNSIELPKTIDEYVGYAREWQKRCGTSLISYEYHFYVSQYKAPDLLSFARVIHEDVIGYKKQGFLGIIEDGTQRCFTPNGLNLFVYAATLFDVECDFDELVKDYFSHAYGEDWREVKRFFERVRDVFDPEFIMGHRKRFADKSRHYDPDEAVKLREMPTVAKEFEEFFASHKNMPYRAQTVAYKLLRFYSDLLCALSRAFVRKAFGAEDAAKEEYKKMLAEFGKYEHELKTYYDQHMLGMAFDGCFHGQVDIMNIGG